MGWICLALVVLCIAMSCVALWCRKEWVFEEYMRSLLREELRTVDDIRCGLEAENKQTKDLCDLLRKESAEKSERIVALLDENNKLRQQLPKRDSKGRFCKK
ncbi:MAG: hypothetical protein J6V21_00385 [Alistipes sp.]|nr:hypothetical protein [Alistipes sp.]